MTKEEPIENPKEIPELLTKRQIFFRSTALALVFVLVFFVITIIVLGLVANHKFNQFLKAATVSRPELISTLKAGLDKEPINSNGYKNILLLGTDSLVNRGDSPPLTDTMILASVNFNQGQIKLLSLPRDIWHEDYRTKINALLYYGDQRDPQNPTVFPKQVVEEMTGVTIHHVIVLSMEQLQTLIDSLGGIPVTIEQGFVDHEFPRTDVDIHQETDPEKLYETVVFEPGVEVMSGERALKYIRSRHSDDDQGNDLARSQRQQQVFQALFARLRKVGVFINRPELAGQLYRYYLDNFDSMITVTELIATIKHLLPYRQQLSIQSHQLSIYPDDQQGVITHPPIYQYQNQWVYIIRDPILFKQEVTAKLR